MKNTKICHIAFIMDGNGRWANNLKKPRTFGHQKGVKVIPEILNYASELDIKYFSFFAFSTENWKRPKQEVQFLLHILEKYMSNDLVEKFNKINAKFNWIGFEENLNTKLIKKIKDIEFATSKNNGIEVNIFFNYSGKKDIEIAFKKAINMNEQNADIKIKDFLLTKNLPEIDLLIRTGNEKRISNFSLYDIAYSEIIFEETLWPNYSIETLKKNIDEYNNRNRRFGEIKSEK